jgi:hypothetical protein
VTLADKRKVIEALLCGSTFFNEIGVSASASRLGLTPRLQSRAMREREAVKDESLGLGLFVSYSHTACEAAYRLIESSPTLIREWFGRSAR